MRTSALAAACLSIAACSGPSIRRAQPGDVLTIGGKLRGGPAGLSAADLAGLPRRTVRGSDPRVGREAVFSGPAVAPLLADRLPLQPGVDLLVFVGRGGYRAAVPFNAIRQSQPVLADQVDGRPVEEWAAGSGPFVLAWPDAEVPGLDTDPRHRWWWVRAVTSLELASWREVYGRALRVPPGAGDEARHGADTLASQCIHCHRLRGQGGEAGPELTDLGAGGDVAERLTRALAGHLAAKSGVPGTPELGPAAIREVAAFLGAIHLAAERPQDEVREPEAPPAARPPPGTRRP